MIRILNGTIKLVAYTVSLLMVCLGLSLVVDRGWIVFAMGIMLYGIVLTNKD